MNDINKLEYKDNIDYKIKESFESSLSESNLWAPDKKLSYNIKKLKPKKLEYIRDNSFKKNLETKGEKFYNKNHEIDNQLLNKEKSYMLNNKLIEEIIIDKDQIKNNNLINCQNICKCLIF